MKEQEQLRKEPNGDCLRAALATLLEIKIEKVPDITLESGETNGFPSWWFKLQEWLSGFGLFFLEVHLPPNMPWQPLPFPALCIFFGETVNKVKHAIVGRVEGDQFIPLFNPWPEAEFADGISGLGFILPRDPHLVIQFGKALDKISKLASGIEGVIARNIQVEAEQALGRQINGVHIEPSNIIVPDRFHNG